jgi:hypothetical protein
MSTLHALVILDSSNVSIDEGLNRIWRETDFSERLREIGDDVVVWDPSRAGTLCGFDVVRTREELLTRAATCGAQRLVRVEPTQVFLDVKRVRRALRAWDVSRCEYFTQWEHCRLPVGIGVQGLTATAFASLQCESITDALAGLREAPNGVHFHYDVLHRTTFEQSLLDARDSSALRSQLAVAGPPASWDLEGFLAWADSDEAWRYTSEIVHPRRDERGLPAAYGFESDACAEFPTYVMFDITNLCNAACIHCPQSIVNEDGTKPEYLENIDHLAFETFQRVVDECEGQELTFVRITADGEPFVHKRMLDMVRYATDRGVGPVGLTTNGSMLSEKRARALIEAGVAIIDISLDAAEAETYEEIRAGLKFNQVIKNVLKLLELREELDTDVQVMVSFVKQEMNVGQVEAFRAFWEPRVDKVLVREMISNVGLNDATESAWPGWDRRWPCAHLFRRVVINHRGQLKYCPIDWRQETTGEPVDDVGIFDAWHSDFYWEHRMQHLNDAFAPSSACGDCKDWAGTPWTLGYEKVVAKLRSGSRSTAA